MQNRHVLQHQQCTLSIKLTDSPPLSACAPLHTATPPPPAPRLLTLTPRRRKRWMQKRHALQQQQCTQPPGPSPLVISQ